MGNGFCKKDYSKDEVNVVENTQIRLQKMKKNIAMTSFYCLVSKIWKKKENNILCCYKKGKKGLVCVVSLREIKYFVIYF